jgi:hypothetical protein
VGGEASETGGRKEVRTMFPGGYCGGLGVSGWLLMIGFWAALLAVVVWAVTRLFPSNGAAKGPNDTHDAGSPCDALDGQLAAPISTAPPSDANSGKEMTSMNVTGGY